MESSFQSLESVIQYTSENDFSSKKNDEESEIPDYEKKRLENIAEKKAMFEEKLRNAKLAVKAKPFKCSKCLSEFMKKAQLKSHQCFKCDLCNKNFKSSQSFYKHGRVEHDGHFTMKSNLKPPAREKKNIGRLVESFIIYRLLAHEELRPFDIFLFYFYCRCIEISNDGCQNEQTMADLVKIMISTMTEHFEHQAERNKKRSEGDFDEGNLSKMLYNFFRSGGWRVIYH